MDFDPLAEEIGQALKLRRLSVAVAESCTGGWVAEVITSVPGSSQWFDRGFIVYSNLAKQEMLGVNAALLLQYGAVSEQVVRAMAEGALAHSRAQVAIAITGIAGPDGGSDEKPVGTVWFAWAFARGATVSKSRRFDGNRAAVRRQAVVTALTGLLQTLGNGAGQ